MSYLTISDFTNLTLSPKIKTVLLDLDNTFYQYDPCHRAGLIALQGSIENITGHIPHFNEIYKQAQMRIKEQIPSHGASHSRLLYAQAMLEILGRNDAHCHAHHLNDTYWNAFLSKMKKTTGLDGFLANCRHSGTTTVVVSDLTADIQCLKLERLQIAKQIDYLVTTEEAGAEKPDPKPFLLALSKSKGNASEAIMIGDNPERDIAGATSLGIASILIKHEQLPTY